MAWKDVSGSTVAFDSATSNLFNSCVSVNLQYDDASETPTSVKVRFKVSKNTTSWRHDSLLILYNPSSSSKPGTLYKVKPPTSNAGSWPYYSSSFKLTKTYTDAKFSLAAYWICNNGNNADGVAWADLTAANVYSRYKDASVYRGNFSTHVAKKSYEISKSTTVATEVTKGTCEIIDNGDNTFKLKGTKGGDGKNNTATGPTLKWGYDKDYDYTFTHKENKPLSIKTPENEERKVYAKSVTGATHGSDKVAYDELGIKQYVAPSKPKNISINYTRSRMTVKENWTLKWTGGTEVNGSSKVKGYRIRIFKNGKTIQFKNSKGEVLTSGSSSDYYYDREDTSTTMNINTSTNGFAPGDKVKVSICTYTRYKEGKGSALCSGAVESDEYTVQNAGVANVKVSGAWKEGKIWVKVSGAWKEAEVAKAKVSGAWKESQ